MKILYITGDIGVEVGGRKGASTHVRETCHAFARFGNEVLILTPSPGDESQIKVPVRRVAPPTAKWMGSDMRYLELNRRMRKAIKHAFETFKPDAVYERYSLYQTAGLEMCRKYGIPRILEVNTLLAREQSARLHFPKLAEMIERSLWRRESALICVSHTLKRLMTEKAGIREEGMAGFMVSPVAVDPHAFDPRTEPASEILQLAQGRKTAGYVGTLTAWHGVDLFFDAAAILKERNAPVLIIAVGGEDDRVERLRARVRERNLESHLCFYGSILHSRVPAFLSAMDVCLIADTQDWSSPTKFFEFAAMQKPIVASHSPSVHEVFGVEETAGLFFERGNAQAMADRILELLNNPEAANKLGLAARERVLTKYTWACNVRLIMKLYRALGLEKAEFPEPACPTPPSSESAVDCVSISSDSQFS